MRVTYEPGDSDRIVEEALKAKDVDVLVAAGGDGSVNEASYQQFQAYFAKLMLTVYWTSRGRSLKVDQSLRFGPQ